MRSPARVRRSPSCRATVAALALACAPLAEAAPRAYTGPDYSGIYDCKGDDAHEGPYTGTVTLSLVRAQSTGRYGAYLFRLEVPGYGTYPGQAAADGDRMGIHFALTDQATKDYGTGIATFRKDRRGRWTFVKYYFEPEFKGGNHGVERCTRR